MLSTPTTAEKKLNGLAPYDWALLPLTALFTILFIALATEAIARRAFPVSESGLKSCFSTDDPSGNAPVKPNSVCSERIAENSTDVEYRFDSRGNRSETELAPKATGVFRIVLIGSSFAMGLHVPHEKTFAALLPSELMRRTGRQVELYNESTGGRFRGGSFPSPSSIARLSQLSSTSPDMILWVITPQDIENAYPDQSASQQQPPTRWSIAEVLDHVSRRIHLHWDQSRTSVMLRHFFIENESPGQYVESYLKNDADAESLENVPSARWQTLQTQFQADVTQIERQSSAARVPLVAVLLPNRAQAAMLSTNQWPSGYDPYKLGRELRVMIMANGATYVDILPDFRHLQDAQNYYLPVDGHLDAAGQSVVAQILATELTDGAVPFLRARDADSK